MSNKIITKNDLAAVLSGVLPPTPSEYKKLLWTNSSPTSTFAAQTISLDLSDYEEVEVEYVDHNVHISTMSQIRVKIGQSGSMNIMIGNSSYSSGVPFVANRRFSVTQTGITFGDGAGTPVSSSLATRNDSCIPYRIYGIKYERVAPPQVEYPNYSTEEQQVGTWATGKPLYRKVLQYSSMPNNTTAVYAHNITNMDIVVRFSCCWWDSMDGRFLMSPRIDSSTVNVRCSINKTNIVLEAIGTNWSTRTNNVNVIVEYTKTTD